MTKIADVRAKSEDELGAMLLDLRREQFNLRFQRATGQAEGSARMKVVRRDIARVKTVLHQNQAKTMTNTMTKTMTKTMTTTNTQGQADTKARTGTAPAVKTA